MIIKSRFLLVALLFLLTLISSLAVKAVLLPITSALIPDDFHTLDIRNLSVASRTFRLLFVSASATTAEATQIIYYNNFVQDAARRNPLLEPFADGFRAIGSTADIDARDNTNTNPASGTGYPIYFVGGHKVADNYARFYGTNWLVPPEQSVSNFIVYDETGEENMNSLVSGSLPAYRIWTGSNDDGIKFTHLQNLYLGATNTYYASNNDNPISFSLQASTNKYPLYGLSASFTIDNAIYTITSLTLKGNNPDFVGRGRIYRDPGAIALGREGTATISTDFSRLVQTTSTLDTNTFGRYGITYTITDSSGTQTTATRSVYVVLNDHLDIDNNGRVRANSDGLMIWHYLNGNRNENFFKTLVGKNATIATPSILFAYIKQLSDSKILDIDASGQTDHTDGKLILKYLIGFRGYGLTSGLTLSGSRNINIITAYLDALINPLTWTKITNNAQWSRRFGHSSVAFADKMWVLGGIDSAHNNDVWYSTDGENWQQAEQANDASWTGRNDHSSVVFDEKMWVLGGLWPGIRIQGNFGELRPSNDVWSYKDASWTQATATAAWPKRYGHSSVVFDGKMWVLGGYNRSKYFNDVWYSTNGKDWTPATTTAVWTERNDHSSVAFKNKIWIFGGYDGSKNLNDVWSSTDGKNWTQAATETWPGRSGHSTVVFRDKIWVFGGFDGSKRLNDIWSSKDGKNWLLEKANNNEYWQSRNAHTSIVFKKKIWLLGGRNENGFFHDVWSSNNE